MNRVSASRIIFVAGVALGGLASVPARASVLWRGDFSTGDLSQWQQVQEVDRDRLQVVGMDGGDGFALKVTVRQGDNPIDASGNRNELEAPPNEPEGSERWYHWQVLWPQSYPTEDTWQLFTQFHHTGASGSPPVEFYVKGEQVCLRVQGIDRWSAPLVRGAWHDFVFHVRWSPAVNHGFVELWYDGEQVLDRLDAATMYEGEGVYLKQGLYRDASIQPEATLFLRGTVVGTTRQDIVQGSSAPPVTQGSGSASGGAGSGSAGSGGGGCASTGAGALALVGALGLLLARRRKARDG